MSIRVHENDTKRTTCPFCHGLIARGESVWECPRCATVHHADCARDNRRCTVLGCEGRAEPGLGEPEISVRDIAPPNQVTRVSPEGSQLWRVVPPLLAVFGVAVATFVGRDDGQQSRENLPLMKQQVEQIQRETERGTDELEATRLLRSVLRRRKIGARSPESRAEEAVELDEALGAYRRLIASHLGNRALVRAGIRTRLLAGPPPVTDPGLREIAEAEAKLGWNVPPSAAEVDALLGELDGETSR